MSLAASGPCDETIARASPESPCGRSAARWALAATILGSGMAFLDGTVVSVALPVLQKSLNVRFAGAVGRRGLPAFSLLAMTVAPLTTAVLNAVDREQEGTASGINNAVARVAGLLAIAALGIVASRSFDRTLTERLSQPGFPPRRGRSPGASATSSAPPSGSARRSPFPWSPRFEC